MQILRDFRNINLCQKKFGKRSLKVKVQLYDNEAVRMLGQLNKFYIHSPPFQIFVLIRTLIHHWKHNNNHY